jgi:hypothetical protein
MASIKCTNSLHSHTLIAGSRRLKRQTIWDPIKKGEFGNDVVEDTYKYQGCRKVGMIVFTIFLMLPEGTQMTILDTVIPTLIGSIVYGNVKVYQTKKQAWMLPAMDLAGEGLRGQSLQPEERSDDLNFVNIYTTTSTSSTSNSSLCSSQESAL